MAIGYALLFVKVIIGYKLILASSKKTLGDEIFRSNDDDDVYITLLLDPTIVKHVQ